MKLICILIFVSVNIFSQTIYTTTEAAEHIGDSISVAGTITEIFTSEKGNTFLSFDGFYPDHTFSAVLFSRNNIDISTIKVGSKVTLHGWIISFNGKPQIIINEQSQIVESE